MEIDVEYKEVVTPRGTFEKIPFSHVHFLEGEKLEMDDFHDSLKDGPRKGTRVLDGDVESPRLGVVTVSGVVDKGYVLRKISEYQAQQRGLAMKDNSLVHVRKNRV